jgi:hypothetical protein
MTRRPPAIIGVLSSGDGGFDVRWGVDTFFPDSAPPEKVLIELNGVPFKELDGDDTSVEVPAPAILALGASLVQVGVIFLWSGSPPEEQQSVITVPVQLPGGGGTGVFPAMKPIVTLVRVQPQTPTAQRSITIHWKSNNYNDGNIFWGPENTATPFVRNIRPPNDSVSSGDFTTDQPLTPGKRYFFRVEVRNTLHSTTWISTTIFVRAAIEATAPIATTSVRQFLQATGRPVTTALATIIGAQKSLRRMLNLPG